MRAVRLTSSPAGHAAPVVAGLALIGAGAATAGTGGVVLTLIGVVPLVSGAAGARLAASLVRIPPRAC
jgi:hypothetical protein